MTWHNESLFRSLLKKIAAKATIARLTRAADIAVADEDVACKYVCGLVIKEMKELKIDYKIRMLYALGSIVRASAAKNSARSKYVEIWGKQLDTIAALLHGISPKDKDCVGRVLKIWWRDGIFPASTVLRLQSQFPVLNPVNSTKETLSSSSKIAAKTTSPDYWDTTGARVVAMSSPPPDLELPASPPSAPPLQVYNPR